MVEDLSDFAGISQIAAAVSYKRPPSHRQAQSSRGAAYLHKR